jgi:hypothetical protein
VLTTLTSLLCSAASAGSEFVGQTPAALARATVAAEAGVALDAVRVIAMTAVQWPDTSLGCPQSGAQYRPVVTPGHRVVLEARGRSYTVHVAGNRAVICRASSAEPRMVTGTRLAQLARRDLAARLGIDPDAVKITLLRAQSWPDASLGCPKPGVAYAQVVTAGFVIELQTAGGTYRYHSSLSRVVACD